MSFKEKIYSNYYKNQASRTANDPEKRLKTDARIFLKDLSKILPADKNARIFELGAGYGTLQKFLESRGYSQSMGVDVSREQVDLATKLGIKNVHHGDAVRMLKDSTGEFDLITGIDFLEHFENDEALQILELVNSKLKPGGLAVFRCPNIDSPMGSVYAYGDLTHGIYFNKSSAEQLMTAAGFENTQIHPCSIYVHHRIKRIFQMFFWWAVRLRTRIDLFATGHSQGDVVLTPNLLMVGKK